MCDPVITPMMGKIIIASIIAGGQAASAKLKKPPVNVQLPPGDVRPPQAVEDPYAELLKATQMGGLSRLGGSRDLLDKYGVVPFNPAAPAY